MKKYQYQVIRYIHDYATGEFVNVGLVIYEPTLSYLRCKVIPRFGRVSNFFLDVKGHYLISTLKYLETEINKIADNIYGSASSYLGIEAITSSILPKDDSALVCTEAFMAIDTDMDMAFNDLFERLVNKYTEDPEANPHNDNYAWKQYYKEYFEKYGLTKKLGKHSVKTNTDVIEFDKAWKNGVWNCYQSVSFDLSRTDSIKNKAYKWSGILKQLETTNEPLHIYFLTAAPKKDGGLKKLIEEALTLNSPNVSVTLVTENEAEQFAEKVKKDMGKSCV